MTAKALLQAAKDREVIDGFPTMPHVMMDAEDVVKMQWWQVQEALPKLKVYKTKIRNLKLK